MTILSKACKPDNFESHNSLKLSFTNIRGLRSNFVDCESFLESNSPDILALCETNLDGSIDSGNLPVRDYFPLIRRDSITLVHGLPFAQDLLHQVFSWLYFTQHLISFSSIDHLLHLCAWLLILFRLLYIEAF